jgi:hypothetical protein
VIVLLLVFIGIVYLQLQAPKPIDWRKTYKQSDDVPFGCKALYDVLENAAFKGKLETLEQNIYSTPNAGQLSSTIFINDAFGVDAIEAKMLLEYVAQGNKVLIAASSFSGKLADTLRLKTSLDFSRFISEPEETDFRVIVHLGQKDQSVYTYNGGITPTHFTSFDTAKTSVIATDIDKKPIFVSLAWGKGAFYVVSTPDIFANYNVVNKPARSYAYRVLSYIDMPLIRWDENYKTYNPKIKHPLQFIFGNDALYAAYSVGILAILIFMAFNLKRRQRAIPVITPPSNSTIEFVEVIGNVYFSAKNHKVIADEKILAFLEHIRSRFQVNTQYITEDVLLRISTLSGIEREEIDKLFELINIVQNMRSITETRLIELNTLIEQFHKKNKR